MDHRTIAVWSGPRNISTAMMRSWEARGDAFVVDEPLYAFYLSRTGRDHPGAAEVVRSGETDWRRVAERLSGAPPRGFALFYQKHMAHHLLPEVELGWIGALANALLIREPREMLLSLTKVTPDPAVEDTGLPQQVRLFEHLRDVCGAAPPVVDARDVLEEPAAMLEKLCGALGVAYTDRMLSWEAGPRESDGVWAEHWYAGVRASTGFAPYVAREGEVPRRLRGVLRECEALHERLHAERLR